MPEAMIDCTGAPVILENMHNYVCHGGRIALVGWPHNPVAINTVRLMQNVIKDMAANPADYLKVVVEM